MVSAPAPVTFAQAPVYGASVSAMPVSAGPARVNCPPEIFQKLAAGGQLTPQEMDMLTGKQPAPEQSIVGGAIQSAGASVAAVQSVGASIAAAPAAVISAAGAVAGAANATDA